MREFVAKFLNDMHFFRVVIVGGMTWGGLALVSPVGRALWEKMIYTAPVAFGVSVASISGVAKKP